MGNQSAICSGDQRFSSLASTTVRSLRHRASLAGLGRRARGEPKPRPRSTGNERFLGWRRSPLRSSTAPDRDQRRSDVRISLRRYPGRSLHVRPTTVGPRTTRSAPRVARRRSLRSGSGTAAWERPTALGAMGRMYSPASYRSQTSACSAADIHVFTSHLPVSHSFRCQPRWCVDPLRPPGLWIRTPGASGQGRSRGIRLAYPRLAVIRAISEAVSDTSDDGECPVGIHRSLIVRRYGPMSSGHL